MHLAPLLLFALSSCASNEGPASSGTSPQDGGTASSTGQVVAEIDPRIWRIHQHGDGDYWFGSNGNGVYRYDGESITNYTETDGLSGRQVRGIVEDSKGTLFISTIDGVSKFDGEEFTTLEFVDAPPDGGGWVLNPEDVWIVFKPGVHGPCRYDGEKLYNMKLSKSPVEDALRAKYPDSDFPPSAVYSIYEDRRGHLWFGTANAGLCRYDGRALSWMYEEPLTITPSGGAFGIRSVYEDRAGDFWICNTRQRFAISREVTRDGEFSLLDYETKAGLPDATLDTDENFRFYHSMTEDAVGALWMVCGGDGAWRYDGEVVKRYPIGEGAYAVSIYRDHGGKLWVGTLEHGIHVFEGESFEPFRP